MHKNNNIHNINSRAEML